MTVLPNLIPFFPVLDDHTVINLNTLRSGRYLSIRTLTDNGGESQDSTSIDLDDVLKKVISVQMRLLFYSEYFTQHEISS